MQAWQHVPGTVVPSSLVIARCGLAASSSDATRSPPKPFDADVTTGYVETILRHCSHAFHYGVASHLVLGGDADWCLGIMPNSVVALAQRMLFTAQQLQQPGPSQLESSSISLSAGTFDASQPRPHFDANVFRLTVRQSDPVDICRRAAAVVSVPQSDGRKVAWIRISVPDYQGCEISCTVFVLPPQETMSWELHQYLRNVDDDLLLSRNALTMFAWHTTQLNWTSGMNASDAMQTLGRQKDRLCAAIPNTPAAKYLLQDTEGHRGKSAADVEALSGKHSNSSQISEEMQAMEAEIASLRAACMQLSTKNHELERNLTQLKQLTAQQQQMHSALLEGATGSPLIRQGGLAGVLLPPLHTSGALVVQQEKKGPASQRQRTASEDTRPLRSAMESVSLHLQELEEVLAAIQSSSSCSASGSDVLKGCLLWRQQESAMLLTMLRTTLQTCSHELPASQMMHTPLGALTVGASVGVDPLTALYRSRLVDVEQELMRLSDFDVDGFAAKFFTDELLRMEGEVVAWMSRSLSQQSSKR